MANRYTIQYKGVEDEFIYVYIVPTTTPDDDISIEASDSPTLDPSIMESVNTDDDKTTVIKSKRLTIGFNSGDYASGNVDIETFSGDDIFLAGILSFGSASIPFIGSLAYEDNQEAFQPQPNPVQLTAVDGLNSLRDIELKTADDEIPVGHYSIIEYISMCLSRIPKSDLIAFTYINVVFNLYEEDTDMVTSHAFVDTFVDALTFEKDVDSREDCLTVLTKILDSFGCFICYDDLGWWIIRWDEYDGILPVTDLRKCVFNIDGDLISQEDVDLTKVIAHDQSAEYEGYRLSMDSAVRRFQKKVKGIRHFYTYSFPKEIPCNGKFTRGDVIDDVLPLKTFELDCWEKTRVIRTTNVEDTTTSFDAFIQRRYDTLGNESERVLVLTPQTQNTTYWEGVNSQPFPVSEGDKFDFSLSWRLENDIAGGGTLQLVLFDIIILGNDSSKWILGNTLPNGEGTWLWSDSASVSSLVTWVAAFVPDDEDEEEFSTVSIDHDDIPPIPVEGDMVIRLHAINQNVSALDNEAVNYQDLTFTYVPFINGSYDTINGQQVTVTGDDTVNKITEHEMFLSDSPKRLFKGALKKFNGTNYILTETWLDNINTTLAANTFAWFIVFQWWNTFRKHRTLIETDVQGMNQGESHGIPGLIHRWQIKHGNEGDKYFMLTSLRDMNFRTSGWAGVFVETSDSEGDRNYDDTFEFKFIQ